MLNFIGTYQSAYGADIADISTIGTLYSVGPESSITMAFNNAMWAKYKFGEYQSLTDGVELMPKPAGTRSKRDESTALDDIERMMTKWYTHVHPSGSPR